MKTIFTAFLLIFIGSIDVRIATISIFYGMFCIAFGVIFAGPIFAGQSY